MAELRWTLEALDWLEDIHHYIAQDNPVAATRVIDEIVEKAELLSSFPEIGTRLLEYSMVPWTSTDTYLDRQASALCVPSYVCLAP